MARGVENKYCYDRLGNESVRYLSLIHIWEEPYAEYKTYDIGDIVGLDGEAFRTNAGEISVKCHSVMLLAKSLLPLPEKFHGLKDMDLRYRQRYVDLIVNPEVRDTFIKRSKIIKAIRDYLDDKGFMEVETPIPVSYTHLDVYKRQAWNPASFLRERADRVENPADACAALFLPFWRRVYDV